MGRWAGYRGGRHGYGRGAQGYLEGPAYPDGQAHPGDRAHPGGQAYPEGRGALLVEGSGAAVPLEIAASYRARTRGLLGRTGIEGAILLTPAGSVHTFGMGFTIEVAYLDRELTVLAVRTMAPGRLGRPRLRARHVLEAAAGALTGWGVRPGAAVRITPGAATDR